ncbi:MAG: hypothetical protein ACRDTS_12155 [Mycobacterium sp.]
MQRLTQPDIRLSPGALLARGSVAGGGLDLALAATPTVGITVGDADREGPTHRQRHL